MTENQGDSLVTSVPSGYDNNKLQQERVISQTYTIKEEATHKEDEPSLSGANVKELKGSETDWQEFTKKDTYSRDNTTFGVF